MRLRSPIVLLSLVAGAAYMKVLQLRIRRRRQLLPPRCALSRRLRLCHQMWRHSGVHAQIRTARVQFQATDGQVGRIRELSAERS